MSTTLSRGTLLIAGCALLIALTAPAQVLTTTFANNNGSGGNMFEVKSLTGIRINSFDTNVSNGNCNFEVWALNSPGTFLGNQTSNANWTLLASLTGIPAAGAGNPTPLGLNLGFIIPAGASQSFYIARTNGTLNYTNGNTVGSLFASNSDLEFYEGTGGGYFNVTIQTRVWNGNIHYAPVSNVSDDAQLSSITAPTNDELDCNPLSATEAITVEVRNLGMNSITAGSTLTMSYQINGGAPIIEFFVVSADIPVGGTIPFTFVTTADLSSVGNHTITASVLYALDLDASNDSLSSEVGSGGQLRVTSYPYIEDFTVTGLTNGTTEMPVGWVQETTDGTGDESDWRRRNDATPTSGTGPAADHTGGISGMGGYIYVDDNGNQSAVNLRSPCFDLSGLLYPSFRFYLHHNNTGAPATEAILSVDVITQPTGTITTNVLGPLGSSGDSWEMHAVDLSPFAGQLVQLVLRANTTGTSSLSDIAIDDCTVVQLAATPGQAPRPGLALFDLNKPSNINGDSLEFGFGGPYFTSVSEGDIVIFRMEGEAQQPIVLFSGPLNPVAASFPGIGSMDCGGPIDPVSGLPTLLTILADGSQAGGFNPFFVTTPAGETNVGFSIPALPLGVVTTFQCAFFTTSGAGVALSNAVQLSVN